MLPVLMWHLLRQNLNKVSFLEGRKNYYPTLTTITFWFTSFKCIVSRLMRVLFAYFLYLFCVLDGHYCSHIIDVILYFSYLYVTL